LTNTVEARQKLDYQQSESDLVLKVRFHVLRQGQKFIATATYSYSFYHIQELKKLTPENTVYKLIGPGLMPQDAAEAQQTVEKRLDFIKKEM
jgi:hypothetical protein